MQRLPSWTWDPAKAAANLRKHGVSFELAAVALDTDTGSLSETDPHPDRDRCDTLALIGSLVLYIVHTHERIISARPATPRERRKYHNETQ